MIGEPVDLRQRSTLTELMDGPGVADAEIHQALRELAFINRTLGGISTTLAGLAPRLRGRAGDPRRGVPARILDVGTGGGDLPIAIVRWCRKERVPVRIVAVDIGASACRFTADLIRDYPEIEVCRADVRSLPFAPRSFDLAHCAMFLHHLNQEEVVQVLRMLSGLVTDAIVINDLHRNSFAYYSIRVLTRLFSRNRLVRNDGPVSVRRGFRSADLEAIRDECRFPVFCWRWKWAFRYLCEIEVNGKTGGESRRLESRR